MSQEIKFPLALDAWGGMEQADEAEQIRQSVRLILLTNVGERPMLPAFGSRVRQFLFEPMNETTRQLLRQEVISALTRWEPRIRELVVETDTGGLRTGRLRLDIRYVIRATGDSGQLAVAFDGEA